MGWIPANAQLTPRPESLASWDSIPEDEKPFQRRLMEVAAGYAEHADHHVGRLVDEVEQLGYGDNTLIFYIWGDNGSSSEGQNGTISELLAQNGIPTTVPMHIKALESAWRPRRARFAQDRQPVSRRLGLGRQHALQGDQAPGLALWRHPQPHGRAVAREDQARPNASLAIPPRERRGPDHLRSRRHHAAARGQRHPARSDRRRQLRLYLRRRESQRPQAHPVFRDHGQPRHLPRRLDGFRLRPAHPVGSRESARHPRVDARQRQVGTLQPRRRLVPGQRPRRQDAGESSPR